MLLASPRWIKNRSVVNVGVGVCLVSMLVVAIFLLPSVLGWDDNPPLRIPELEDLRTIDARGFDPSGNPLAEFELPRRYNARVRDFFLHRRGYWNWNRPPIPDQARVAQLRLHPYYGALTLDIYNMGQGQIGVGTSGGRLLFDTPGVGAAELLTLLQQAEAWVGIPPVTEIALDRSMCLGTCPVDSIVFRVDGTASYKGGQNVARIGQFTGSITPSDFRRLAKLVDDYGFADMKSGYSDNVSCVPVSTTTVRWNSFVCKTANDGRVGPAGLIAIQDAIIGQVDKIDWQLVP